PEVPDDLPGWGLEPDPLQAKTVAEFIAAMRAYRQWAGAPSYREMVHRVGTGSAAGFCEALKSDRLPKFALLNAFIVSLGGDGAVFQRWVTAWRAPQSAAARYPGTVPSVEPRTGVWVRAPSDGMCALVCRRADTGEEILQPVVVWGA